MIKIVDQDALETAIASVKGYVDGNVSKKMDKSDITQNTGQSTTAVMSQKAVTDALNTAYPELNPIYNVNMVIDFGGGNSLNTFSFYSDFSTLNSMLIAVKNHTEGDAPVEGIFTFVNFSDINGINVTTPVSVKTTSVWCDEHGQFNCALLLCGRMCTLTSESDSLDEITPDITFSITLKDSL